VGFEPTLRFPVNTLSKRAPSATRPPLQTYPPYYMKWHARRILRRQPFQVFDLSAVAAAGTIAMQARPTTRRTAAYLICIIMFLLQTLPKVLERRKINARRHNSAHLAGAEFQDMR
jgi:hypothetical protein